jgi:hypothetical protein
MIGSGEHPMFAFGWPHDVLTFVALCIGLLIFLPWSVWMLKWPVVTRAGWRWGLWGLSMGAGLLSLGYFYHYLGGHSRIIDATTYLFQARSLAQGSFGYSVPGPSASYRGRFIVSVADDPNTVAGIFPPGYPALLSLGVRLGHAEWVGPALAAGLVLATYYLTLALFRTRTTALLGAAFSTLCVCLRYHTADTMSHGWSALLSTCAVLCTVLLLKGTVLLLNDPPNLLPDTPNLLPDTPHRKHFVILCASLGLSLGLLVATRQLTGLLIGLACLVPLGLKYTKSRVFWLRGSPLLILGALPGIILLLAQHDFITGSPFLSPQHYYYDRADGPPGCFRLGWGSGCHYEHADAVAMQGGQGLTAKWSLLNTLHRLHWHSLDIANFEPLALVALWSAWHCRQLPRARPLLYALMLIPLGYAAFYFNGSYPGGGARLFSELLPLWHSALAYGLVRLRLAKLGLFLAIFGYSVHASFSHDVLASAHFGPGNRALDRINAEVATLAPEQQPALVLFSTAHHFNLSALSSEAWHAARSTLDDRESMVQEAVGAATLFRFEASTGLPAPAASHQQERASTFLESEYDYPALQISEAWVHPEGLALACVSAGRALRVHKSGSHGQLTLELSAPRGHYQVSAHLIDARNLSQPCRTVDLGLHEAPGSITLELKRLPKLTHIDALELTRLSEVPMSPTQAQPPARRSPLPLSQ